MTMTTASRVGPMSPPAWAKDLIIYELNPRGFTSPGGVGDGDGSGTFLSMRDRLPYLSRLGVTGIWMAGHHVATRHFYGIWSVYAALQPDQIDPKLGTPDDLKDLVATAHRHGIRVFLDVISHGVVEDSPLVRDHPDWFDGGSWRMRDFNYQHSGFRRWWSDLWTNYVVEYGIDGFRIDVDILDATLWDEIVERTAQAGHEIVVFPEVQRYHFSQLDSVGFTDALSNVLIRRLLDPLNNGLAATQVSTHDGGWGSPPGNHYKVRGSRARFGTGALLAPCIPLFYAGEEFDAEPCSLPNLTRDLYGTGGPGGWLYGSQLRWEQTEDPAKSAMLHDVTTMLRIRRENSDLLNADTNGVATIPIPNNGASRIGPYARVAPGEAAIVIAGNDTAQPVTYQFHLPLEGEEPAGTLQFNGARALHVTDLVTGKSFTHQADELLELLIGADGTPGGGFGVLRVRPV